MGGGRFGVGAASSHTSIRVVRIQVQCTGLLA
jgi:hypothetical protein